LGKVHASRSDQLENARLQTLDVFERHHFDAFLDGMAKAAGLTPPDVLCVIHFAGSHGLIRDLRLDDDGSAEYRKNSRFIGHVPLEIAAALFIEDHWRSNEPLPCRPVLWNEKRAAQRAESFRDTLKLISLLKKRKK
jgi:hypothetical protein